MSLNRLSPAADLEDPAGRGQLQETLDLLASALKRTQDELERVKDSDEILRPVPLFEFPLPMGPISTKTDRVRVGTLVAYTGSTPPDGYLECDGSEASRTTHRALYNLIGTTYGAGDGSTTFNLPDFRGRAILGEGQGSGLTNRNRGDTGGAETHTLVIGEIPSHTHSLSSHTHDMPDHTHNTDYYLTDAGSGNSSKPQRANEHQTGSVVEFSSEGVNSYASNKQTSGPSNNNTNSKGGDGAHNNMQPYGVAKVLVRYVEQPTTSNQSLALAWGGVPGSAQLPTIDVFPAAEAKSLVEFVDTSLRPEAVTSIEASGGAGSGTDTVVVTGVTRVPYNFRHWKNEGLKIRTKVEGSGLGSSVDILLEVHDPITSGSNLAATDSRTTSGDSTYHYMQMTRKDLGPDWQAGYTLKFTLTFTIPKTFTSLKIKVGMLEAHWR